MNVKSPELHIQSPAMQLQQSPSIIAVNQQIDRQRPSNKNPNQSTSITFTKCSYNAENKEDIKSSKNPYLGIAS